MLRSFEIKSYPQLNFMLGIVNAFLAFVLLAVARFAVLSPAHRQGLDDILSEFVDNPVLASLASLGLLALLAVGWGWVSTTFLRIHDRIHEPRLVKWRAAYDSDFILRSLCYDHSAVVSPDLFERAYTDKRIRVQLMQRLFYYFTGDAQPPHEGLRIRFYTAISKYWTLATVEIYVLFSLVVFSLYNIFASTVLSPSVILISVLLFILSRIFANRVLDEIRPITIEQVSAVRRDHAEALLENIIETADELGARRQYD